MQTALVIIALVAVLLLIARLCEGPRPRPKDMNYGIGAPTPPEPPDS
ncbi:MAG: hypothetical protein KGI41_00930 [Patescibacteria group bacterium]|nr:hypothetical protein [Patescibacteria group bacterium]MDE1965793.1 hypothetical protein [Patescibacteria group bacterium]